MKKFEILFNEISDALFLHDFDGNILKVNNYACKRLGYSKQEFLAMNVGDFASEDILQNWETRIEAIKKNGQYRFETSYVTKNKQQLAVEIVSKIIRVGKRELILSSGHDITKRKNYEHQLIESQKIAQENEFELKSIFDKVPSTIMLFDEKSRIIRINEKGILKFNVDASDLEQKKIGDVINCLATQNRNLKCGVSEFCLKCQLANIIDQTVNKKVEFTKKEFSVSIVQKNKTIEKTMLISTAILQKRNQNMFLATIDDITSQKQMERELILAKEKAEESERLKTAFLNSISHEIRTPLNGILGFVDLFDDESYNFSKEEKRNFIAMMHKSGDRLINTVTNLVEVAKLQSGTQPIEEEQVEIYKELQIFVSEQRMQFANPAISFEFQIDVTLENQLVVIDKLKMYQILKNLLNNAFKFTSKGRVKLSVSLENTNLVFMVEDTGIGIDSKYKDCIYEPFRQADAGLNRAFDGNGLGLTIAKKLVDKLGGNIWFESEIEKGTIFYFSVPLKIKEEENFDSPYFFEPDNKGLIKSSKNINGVR